MRTIFLLIAFVIAFTLPMQGQEKVLVPKSELTAEQLAKVTANETKETVKKYGEWVGLGKEVGEAFDGALGAIQKHAQDLADSRLGVFIMFLIAYKIIGTDMVQFAVGVPLLIAGLSAILWSYRKTCIVRRIKVKGGPTPEWKLVNDTKSTDDRQGEMIVHVLVAAAFLFFMSGFLFF
jgi:hypothetical protein